MAHRIVAQIVLVGSRVLGRAFLEAYKQAQASSKYAKAGQVSGGTTINTRAGLTLDEAYKILNVKPTAETADMSMEAVTKKYKILFERNNPKTGGSFYLQSKVFRARERLEQEAKRAGEKAKMAEP